MTLIDISELSLDGGCQPRAIKLVDVIEEYAAAMVAGAEFPPVIAFYDGESHWLADGYHRRDAAVAAGLTQILADIRQGTRRDAILFSVGANAAHGLRRTNDDKRRSVMTLLADAEWARWSDREIARRCGVSPDFANRLRPKDTVIEGQYEPRTFTHPKTGAPATMNTARIGSQPAPDWRQMATERGIAYVDAERKAGRAERNKSADHIWRGVQAIIEAVRSLPSPEEAARQFPKIFAHTVHADDVTAAADWLDTFAPIWAKGQQDRDRRTAELVERAKGEMEANVGTR